MICKGIGECRVITLTDKLDTVNAGSNGIINAVLSSTAGDTTWGVADQITGGTGSTLNLTAVLGGNLPTSGRATNGVENFNITLADSDTTNNHTLTIDASTLNNAKAFTIASATASGNDKIAFTGLAKTQTVTIKSTDTDLDVDLSYKSGEDSGTSDTAAVSLDGGKMDTLTINGAFETVEVNGKGTSSVATLTASGNAVTKLVVKGDGATTISDFTSANWSTSATTKTVDASTATGNVTIGVGALDNKFDIKGGSGTADRINATLSNSTVSSGLKMSGVESLVITSNTGTSSVDLTNATGLTTVGLRSSNTTAVTFNNIAAGSTILFEGAKTEASQNIGSITAAVKGATASAPASSLAVKINNQGKDVGMTGTTENTISVGTFTANNVKGISIEAADGDVASFTLSADKLETLTVKASEDFVFSGTVGAAATTTSIDVSQVTGKATMTLAADLQKDFTYTGSNAVDALTIGDLTQISSTSDNTVQINTGTGNDVVTLNGNVNSTSKTVLKIDLGAGDDKVVVKNASKTINTAKSHTLDFGDGTDTLEWAGGSASTIETMTISGLEKVLLTGSADLSVQAASFSGKSTEITTIGNGRLVLAGTSGADTIDASSLTIVGPNGVKIKGGGGADTITLTSASSGKVETVVFEDTASNNGVDSISGFGFGASGDKLDFTAFSVNEYYDKNSDSSLSVAGDGVAATSSGAIALSGLDNKVVLVTTGNISAQTVDEATLFATGKPFAAEGTTAYNFVLLVGETSGTGGVKVYYVTDGTGADDMAITLVGTLSGVSLQNIVADNIA